MTERSWPVKQFEWLFFGGPNQHGGWRDGILNQEPYINYSIVRVAISIAISNAKNGSIKATEILAEVESQYAERDGDLEEIMARLKRDLGV